jgi:hypothetical protein
MGPDRALRVDTTNKRTHSLFRQGREYLNGVVAYVAHQVGNLFQELLDGLVNNVVQCAEISGDASG